MYRKTWMEIDLGSIEENIRTAKRVSGKQIIAVVKADGYGVGDMAVVSAALNAGACMMAVSSCEEALILRNKGYTGECLILGHTDIEDLPVLAKEGIAVPAYSGSWVKKAAETDCPGLKVHMAADTGMNRIGFREPEELKESIQLLQNSQCNVEGIFTHFCCADSDAQFTERQFQQFAEFVRIADFPFRYIHCDNSEATLSFSDPLSNTCRFGMGMYGISDTYRGLSHAAALYSTVFLVKQVKKGESIGYGATYRTAEDEWIATIPIGYADGLIRKNQGRYVYVDGEYVPIVGRVCMDQTMIRLNHPVEEGTKVEIFGPHIPLEQMAKDLETIPYEILSLISERVTRVYMRNGIQVSERNGRVLESHVNAE